MALIGLFSRTLTCYPNLGYDSREVKKQEGFFLMRSLARGLRTAAGGEAGETIRVALFGRMAVASPIDVTFAKGRNPAVDAGRKSE